MSDHRPVRVRVATPTGSSANWWLRRVSRVCRLPWSHGINANVVFGWLRDPRFGGKAAPVEFLPVAASSTPVMTVSQEKRPDPLDLTVEFPGGVRIHCRDEPTLIVVLRAARRTS